MQIRWPRYFGSIILIKLLLVITNDQSKCTFVEAFRKKYPQTMWLWVLNFTQKWKSRPTITFIEYCRPMILTRQNHNGGTNNLYLHPPWKPPKRIAANFLCRQTKKTKPMKASKYCKNPKRMNREDNLKALILAM